MFSAESCAELSVEELQPLMMSEVEKSRFESSQVERLKPRVVSKAGGFGEETSWTGGTESSSGKGPEQVTAVVSWHLENSK